LYFRCVWAPHIYQPLALNRKKAIQLLCTHQREAAVLDMPGFIGEFGDLTFSSGSEKSINITRNQVDLMKVSHMVGLFIIFLHHLIFGMTKI